MWPFNKTSETKKEVVFEDRNTVREISARYRESLSERLKSENLKFVEQNTRLNYGLIGWIYRNNQPSIQIFGGCFYMHNRDISVNPKLISLINAIQREFADTTRDEKGRICVSEKGFGAID